MKLKDLMSEYLGIEDTIPSQLRLMSESLEMPAMPCAIGGKSTWENDESDYIKDFSFSSREPLRSFCSYILDLEGENGVNFCLNLSSEDNSVSIKIPKRFLSTGQFRSLTNKVDNIHYDVSESFKNE